MRKGLIVAALMMSISLAALDTTVVVTAIPTIVGSLGGISLLSWVFAIYLLTSTVTVPIYGKLSDIYGRKPILMFGCVMFLIGSILCGLSSSMTQLILFRAIQGLGAGAVQPVTLTIIGDLFSIQERAKVQGVISSVWGLASIGGPLLGGLITDTIGWRFVFYVNVPFGVTSIILLYRYFKETPERHEHVLDYWGTLLLSGAIISLLLGLLQGVTSYGWTGGPTLGAFVLAAALLALFIYREGLAEEPVLPLWLFKNRVIAIGSLVSFIIGTVNFGLSSYLPLFVQAVHGGSALKGGITLAPVSFSWTVASVASARLIVRKGYFPSAIIGTCSTVFGAVMLLFVSYSTPLVLTMVAAGFCGFGLGFANSAILISVQNAVSWRFRGVATATNQFFRTIGGSIWVAIMGAVFNSTLSGRLVKVPNIPAGANANTLVNVHDRAAIPAGVLEAMRHAVASSLHDVYFLILLTAVVSATTVLIAFPRGGIEALANRDDEAGSTTGPPAIVPVGD